MANALSSTPPDLPIARFSVEQYHRMIQSGAFSEHDRLELIEGWVVTQMAKGPGHEYSAGRLDELVRERLPPGWHARNQAPITLARSEPEPDLTVARGSREDYRDHHPSAADIALVVEVSDTSLAADRLKGRTYGDAGISEYWIVNLLDRSIEVYTKPARSRDYGYESRAVLGEGEEVSLVVDGQLRGALRVGSLLP
jgi:Uma2 family endonuclease